MTGIFCEEENGFCFGSHLGGNFTKFYKNGTIIFGTMGLNGSSINVNSTDALEIDCDETYCFLGHSFGYFTKVFKNGTVAIGTAGSERTSPVRPYNTSIYGINCDTDYCNLGHAGGYYSRVFKNGTVLIGNGGNESSVLRLSFSDTRGLYCDDIYCYGGHSNANNTKTLKTIKLKVYREPRIVSLNNVANGTGYSTGRTNLTFGFTPNGTELGECYLYGNWKGGWHINQTITEVINLNNNNFSSVLINEEGNYVWNVKCNTSIMAGSVNGSFFSVNNTFQIDFTKPVVINGSGMVENNSAGGSSTFFNWSATDNLDTNLTCYPTMDGINQVNGLKYTLNNTNENVTINLPGGPHVINVTCYDNANNSGQFNGINYLVAEINITSHKAIRGTVVRFGNTESFNVTEISGQNFLTNATISIDNSTNNLANLTTIPVGDSYTTNYTWIQNPMYVNITATSFNNSVGVLKNVTDFVDLVLLRAVGNTTSPVLNSTCPNETYVINGTEILLEMIGDLDTLYYAENLTITSPSGINYKITNTSSSIDAPRYENYNNYTFLVNETGTYNLFANITDYEGSSSTWSYRFYSSAGANLYNISSSTVTNFTRIDLCSGEAREKGNQLYLLLATGAITNINVSIQDDLHNITLVLKEVNLTGNVSQAVNYSELSNETTTPSGKRRVALVEINSSLNMTNYTFTYDYSRIQHTINDESSLKIYQCTNTSNCVLVLLDASINTTEDLVTVEGLSDYGYFMIAENGTSSTTVQVEVPVGSGGGGNNTVYRDIEIITPGSFKIGINDQVIVPIIFHNPENIILKDITVSATSSLKEIIPTFDRTFIKDIDPGENETLLLFLESGNAVEGDYEIRIQASIGSPNFIEQEAMYVRIIANPELSVIQERIVLVQDLFKENPECLELNDLLIQAQALIDEGRIEEAGIITQDVIRKCKDLVTNEEFPINFINPGGWRTPLMVIAWLIVIAFVIVTFIRKPSFNLKKVKVSGSKWYHFRLRNPFGKTKKKRKGLKKNPFS